MRTPAITKSDVPFLNMSRTNINVGVLRLSQSVMYVCDAFFLDISIPLLVHRTMINRSSVSGVYPSTCVHVFVWK